MKRLLILSLLLASCGPTHDLRKAQRLIDRAKAHGAKVTADTVFRDRQITIKGDSTTIIQPIHHYHDTIITLYEDKIRVVQHWRHDTLIQKITCPDTVIRWKERTSINQTIQCPPKDHTWRTVAIVLGVVLLVFVVLRKVGLF